MYGKWFLIAFGFGLLVLFIIGLIATAYAPIFAVGIALLVLVGLWLGAEARRSAQVGAAHRARITGSGAADSA